MRLRDAEWLSRPATQAVFSMLAGGGHAAYAVGGCVRNALLDAPVDDVDICTDARPERVMELCEAARLKAVPTGVDHGTVTVVSDGTGYEVTTFRADVETDGRRAVVRFSDDVLEDARRRDFTMNALYAGAGGEIVDPLGGLADLQARRLRFIEDPERRIREDYLRILRFFRFSAWYADAEAGMDADALAAIASNLDGIAQLSRERIGQEIRKLLRAPDPAPAVAAMEATGALAATLPGTSPRALAPLVHLEALAGVAPAPLRRLAALGHRDGAALRLSKAESRSLTAIFAAVEHGAGAEELGYRFGEETARDALLIRSASLGEQMPTDALSRAARGGRRKLPVKPRDLQPAYEGPALGKRLKDLEEAWISSGFSATREQLLAL
ncbi:poly(A) polymerase [Roseivivax halodurans JCM 10272]|uniref:Poly(A) polymerase n=1 Tax=Roseivivax halodurans JCM 10272 TaxID=1449350 RepID=X7EGI3_9RHOB|nr:CCA tRNA nucleotidyltransferase [Roseivivax halodurans]ETX15027.1 poly(A) polymerase [Roseivivax halodurans JCM 10272]